MQKVEITTMYSYSYTTTYTYDKANQLISSTIDGKTIANNLVAENVDQLALNKKTRIPVKPTHKCE